MGFVLDGLEGLGFAVGSCATGTASCSRCACKGGVCWYLAAAGGSGSCGTCWKNGLLDASFGVLMSVSAADDVVDCCLLTINGFSSCAFVSGWRMSGMLREPLGEMAMVWRFSDGVASRSIEDELAVRDDAGMGGIKCAQLVRPRSCREWKNS